MTLIFSIGCIQSEIRMPHLLENLTMHSNVSMPPACFIFYKHIRSFHPLRRLHAFKLTPPTAQAHSPSSFSLNLNVVLSIWIWRLISKIIMGQIPSHCNPSQATQLWVCLKTHRSKNCIRLHIQWRRISEYMWWLEESMLHWIAKIEDILLFAWWIRERKRIKIKANWYCDCDGRLIRLRCPLSSFSFLTR